jgi:hypothetical protein
MKAFMCLMAMSAFCFWTPRANAQVSDSSLDQDCPIPYTAARQDLLADAYVSLAAKIAKAFPEGNLSSAALSAYYSEVRRIISGEAVQGFHKVAEAYACRLRKKLPINKHAYINAVLAEVKLATAATMLPSNFETPSSVTAAYDWASERVASPPTTLKSAAAADRFTSAEALVILGSPNFTSTKATRAGIEAKFPGGGAGACVGTLRASLSTFDNATLTGLADLGQIFANMAEEVYRPAAYTQLLTHAQGVMAPGASAQIGAQVNATANKSALGTCLRDGGVTAATGSPLQTPPTASTAPRLDILPISVELVGAAG